MRSLSAKLSVLLVFAGIGLLLPTASADDPGQVQLPRFTGEAVLEAEDTLTNVEIWPDCDESHDAEGTLTGKILVHHDDGTKEVLDVQGEASWTATAEDCTVAGQPTGDVEAFGLVSTGSDDFSLDPATSFGWFQHDAQGTFTMEVTGTCAHDAVEAGCALRFQGTLRPDGFTQLGQQVTSAEVRGAVVVGPGSTEAYDGTVTQEADPVEVDFAPEGEFAEEAAASIPAGIAAPEPGSPDPAALALAKNQNADVQIAEGLEAMSGESFGDDEDPDDMQPYDASSVDTEGDGISYTGRFPPDPTMAAGPNDLLLGVNSTLAVYSKDMTPVSSMTFKGLIEPGYSEAVGAGIGYDYFDPWIVYDPQGERFLFAVAARRYSDRSFFIFVGVSLTSSAGAGWCVYGFNYNDIERDYLFGDYPKVGFDSNAIYVTANDFDWLSDGDLGNWRYSSLWALPRGPAYSCQPNVTITRKYNLKNTNGTRASTIQPAVSLGTATAQWMVNAHANHDAYPDGSGLTLWKVTCGGTNCASGYTLSRWKIAVTKYGAPNNAVQKGDSFKLDTHDARLLNAVYDKDRTDVWAAQASARDYPDGNRRSEVRIYRIDASARTAAVKRSYTSTRYRFNPFVMVDHRTGNVAATFTVSGKDRYPSMALVRKISGSWGDPTTLKYGGNPYTVRDNRCETDCKRARWGDYAGGSIDPSASGKTWLVNEYMGSDSDERWRTWVVRVNT